MEKFYFLQPCLCHYVLFTLSHCIWTTSSSFLPLYCFTCCSSFLKCTFGRVLHLPASLYSDSLQNITFSQRPCLSSTFIIVPSTALPLLLYFFTTIYSNFNILLQICVFVCLECKPHNGRETLLFSLVCFQRVAHNRYWINICWISPCGIVKNCEHWCLWTDPESVSSCLIDLDKLSIFTFHVCNRVTMRNKWNDFCKSHCISCKQSA